MRDLGLALSGGGSRAAAFHCGTVRALDRLGLLPRLEVISSVSGGSVFAAAWVAAIEKESTADFLTRITKELRTGFVRRALLNPRVFGLIWPWYSRTDVLASVFESLSLGVRLGQLPERPAVCINVTVLNSGQGGKFGKDGFSTYGLGDLAPNGSNVPVRCDAFPLARAAAASAAFPVGLPPIYLRRKRWFRETETKHDLAGQEVLALSDGGILENLGTQTLLKSRTFATTHIIASDAGTKQSPWRPGSLFYWVRSFFMWVFSGSILERFALIMSDKQSRWMREELFYRATGRPGTRQNILLIRVNTSWEQLVGGMRSERLAELAPSASLPMKLTAATVEETLGEHAPTRAAILAEAKAAHAKLTLTPDRLNAVGTHFFAMPQAEIEALSQHAYWQLLAAYALYWEPWPSSASASTTETAGGTNP